MASVRSMKAPETAGEAAEPSEPYVRGDLMVNYAERRVSLAGRPVQLTDIEYPAALRVVGQRRSGAVPRDLLQRVWGPTHAGNFGSVRTVAKNLRRKLGDADGPTYIFTEPRVGYRMAKGETAGAEEA